MLERQLGLPREGFSVHPYFPQDFLVVCASAELRNHISSNPEVEFAGARLFFRKWNRQAQAKLETWRAKVHLVIEGVPPHT
jgi:hypothetical protein